MTASAPPSFLGIDFGTSGCRAILIDSSAEIIAESRIDLAAPIIRGKSIQQDPGIWWKACQTLLKTIGQQVSLQTLQGMSVNGTSGTVLLVDETGTPQSMALMYNDASASQEALHIQAHAPSDCAALGTSSGLAKIMNLAKGLPEGKQFTATLFAATQADWIANRLRGTPGQSDENNCLKLGYDPITGQWPDWVSHCLPRNVKLPTVCAVGTDYGPIEQSIAQKYNINPQVRIFAGTTDSIAATLAVGVERIGQAVSSLGSTLAIKIVSDRPLFSAQHGIYSHKLGEHWLAGGASNTGGAVLLKYFSQQQLDEMTPQLRATIPTNLNYYPLCQAGERFPIVDPNLEARMDPRPEDDVLFFQGMLEGIAQIERQGYDLLSSLGAPHPTEVFTAGGGSRNPAWQKIRERILGIPLKQAAQTEAAYGSALIAKNATMGKPLITSN